MSSTDAAIERSLRRFFQEKLTSAANRARARGIDFLSPPQTAAPDSYFVLCKKPESLFVSIEPASCQMIVHEIWRRDGLNELADMAGELFALAPMLTPREDAEHDVSPLVYVMF
jgi:hypothetical protein